MVIILKYIDFILVTGEPIRIKKKEIVAFAAKGETSEVYLRGMDAPFVITAKYNVVKEILDFKDKDDE